MNQNPPSPLMMLSSAKKELVSLFKGFGPWWMMAALVVLTLPALFAAVGYLFTALTWFVRAIH